MLKMADAADDRDLVAKSFGPVGPQAIPPRSAEAMRRIADLTYPLKPDGESRCLSVGRGITLSGEVTRRSPQSSGDRKQPSVLAGKADHLQAKRQIIGREQRQRQSRDTEQRAGHVEDWIAGRAEPDGRGSRGGKRNRPIVARCEPAVNLATALPARDCGALIRGGHRLSRGQAIEHRLAKLGAVPVTIRVERPATLPCVDFAGEPERIRDRSLDLIDGAIGMA